MISRMGASVNNAIGLSQLVANDRDALRELIIELAQDKGRLKAEQRKVLDAVHRYQGYIKKSTTSLQTGLKKLLTN